MFNTKFVFAVSIVAMMAVNVANANIAATSYVDKGVTAATNAANAAKTVADAAEASATEANNAIAGLDLSAVGADGSYIKTISQTNGKVSATKEAADTTPTSGSKKMVTSGGVYTALSGKLASVSTTGTGTVVKSIAKDGTEVKGTLGSIESEDITDGAIKDVDIADDANIVASKIDGLATVATSGSYDSLTNKPTIGTSALTIRNGATNTNIATFGANATEAVTVTIPAATSSVAGLAKYGVIPSGSETSTTYATIWVE